MSNHVVHFQTGTEAPSLVLKGAAVSSATWKNLTLCGAESPRRVSSDSAKVTCKLCVMRLARSTEQAIKNAEKSKSRPLLMMPLGGGFKRPRGHGRRQRSRSFTGGIDR